MVQRFDAIQAGSWQLALGRPGEVVTALDDIDQCITVIVTTRRGQVPLRPLFGNEALEYVDRPLNEAAPGVIRGTTEAVKAWEPRAVVDRVIPTRTDAGLQVEIVWHPASDPTQTQATRVTLL
jgi:phage baseplate assembly protein W